MFSKIYCIKILATRDKERLSFVTREMVLKVHCNCLLPAKDMAHFLIHAGIFVNQRRLILKWREGF